MNAAKYAAKLEAAGISVIESTEPWEYEDGEVVIAASIVVQIPATGSKVCVVLESDDGEEFTFYPERAAKDIDGMVAELVKLGIVKNR